MKSTKTQRLNISLISQNSIWALGALASVLLFFYGYFVLNTILNVIEREQIEISIITASSDLAELESEFLNTERLITMEFAKNIGFYEVKKPHYVTRTGLALTPLGR